MMNLAGTDVERNDRQIRAELARSGLTAVAWDGAGSEVKTNIKGVLRTVDFSSSVSKGDLFSFTRAWRYWMVDGRVPLQMAKRIHQHPVGVTDIRVAGHCACPPPEAPWIEWRDPATDKKYARMADADQMYKFRENHPAMFEKFMNEHLFHDDPASIGAVGTVDSYHIDTEIGLYVFVMFLRGQL